MKEKLKKSSLLENWFYTQSPLVIARPALAETLKCLGHLICGFLLSCGSITGHTAPFAMGFIAAVGGGIRGLCSLIGASAGYLTMQPFAEGLQMTSISILVYVGMYIFSSLWIARQQWFCCLVPGIMSAAVGCMFLFSQQPSLLVLTGYAQSILLSALSPLAFGALLRGKKRSVGSLVAIGCFLLGAGAISLPFEMTLGTIAAITLTAVAASHADLGTAAALALCGGIALDLSAGTSGTWCFLLSVGAVAGCGFPHRHPWLRLVGFCVGTAAAGLVLGQPMLLTSLIPGVILSLLVPAGIIGSREMQVIEESATLVEQRLEFGKSALETLYNAVGNDPEQQYEQNRQQVFDRAAGKVCKRCSRYHTCWTRNSQETYQIFRSAMDDIHHRGEALREDFPEDFSMECRHLDGLLVAINQELDALAVEAQCRSRTEELREIVSRSFLHMSKVLGESAQTLRGAQRLPSEAFTVKVGVAAKGRSGSKVSGDRGLCFQTEDGRFFALLCDGAGTGQEAAQESLTAVNALAGLIQAGMPAANAMEMLNGIYVLRSEGCFATMDVLELSLITGQATLYKWGSAPSYIRSGSTVKKIGSAAPPPGLGVGSTYGAEVLRLSLWGGDMVVLVSDGVIRTETENLLRSFEGDNVKTLASSLIETALSSGGGDDMTAAVIRLDAIAP